MGNTPISRALRFLRQSVSPAGGEASDGELLRRFVAAGEESAFAALVRRHEAMVLGVCRRLLGDAHDAEDAFQATFLVLARRAASVRKHESVASWLYGVAYRVARKARQAASRRPAGERQVDAVSPSDPVAEAAWRELRPLLDVELSRLPLKYQAPLVLCYLEGRTNEEAARLLGWTKGTVSGRLARARELLRRRLAGRGLALPAAALPALLARGAEAAGPGLVETTVRAVLTGGVPAPAAALAEGVIRAMFLERMSLLAGAAVALALAVLGGDALGRRVRAGRDEAPAAGREGPAADKPRPPAWALARKKEVRAVAFSPDGKRVLAGDADGAAYFIDPATGKEKGPLHKHPAMTAIRFIAFSPNGTRIALAGTFKFKDPDTGVEQLLGCANCLDGPTRRIRFQVAAGPEVMTGVALSPDAARLAAVDTAGVVALHDAEMGRPERRFTVAGGAHAAAFSPDGKVLATAGADGAVRLWDPSSGNEVTACTGHTKAVRAVAFAGKKVFSASTDGTARVWDAGTGKELRQIPAGAKGLRGLAVSPDGKRLATGGEDGAVRVWDPATGKEVAKLAGHARAVHAVAFSPDGKRLVSCGADGSVRLWELGK
jgi:RNA polymerase sigma factor (sigma-70 family)